MSLLSRAEFDVVLAPAQVALVRTGWTLTRRGPRRRHGPAAFAACPSAAAGAPPWTGAVAAFGQLLGQGLRGARLELALSSRFVRYAVLPWQDGLWGSADDAAYARHHLQRLFGDAALGWEIRIDAGRAGRARLASAVDPALLAGLRERCQLGGATLAAVRPQLMQVFNRWRGRLAGRRGWLLLAEPECLCLAQFSERGWHAVQTVAVGPGWEDDLPTLLERASCLADGVSDAEQVFLWRANPGAALAPVVGGWRIAQLAEQGA